VVCSKRQGKKVVVVARTPTKSKRALAIGCCVERGSGTLKLVPSDDTESERAEGEAASIGGPLAAGSEAFCAAGDGDEEADGVAEDAACAAAEAAAKVCAPPPDGRDGSGRLGAVL
jgi:hypothetical protein